MFSSVRRTAGNSGLSGNMSVSGAGAPLGMKQSCSCKSFLSSPLTWWKPQSENVGKRAVCREALLWLVWGMGNLTSVASKSVPWGLDSWQAIGSSRTYITGRGMEVYIRHLLHGFRPDWAVGELHVLAAAPMTSRFHNNRYVSRCRLLKTTTDFKS